MEEPYVTALSSTASPVNQIDDVDAYLPHSLFHAVNRVSRKGLVIVLPFRSQDKFLVGVQTS